jgi:hydroxypyruvate reductase
MRLASDALAIGRAGIRSVDPAVAVRSLLRRRGRAVEVGDHVLPIGPGGTIHLVAIGKAAGRMADAARAAVGRPVRGIAITSAGSPAPRGGLPVLVGGHPVPDARSHRAGRALLQYVRSVGPHDVVIFLISGGGSALAEVPADGLTVGDVAATTRALLGSGAPIGPMNVVRRHISQLKGGRLGAALGGVPYATVALSDVVGDPPHDIASGPTVPDPTTFADAARAVDRWGLAPELPPRVRHHLREGENGHRSETVKPGSSAVARAPFVLAASNRIALEGAAREARRRGYRSWILSSELTGETREVARTYAQILRSTAGSNRPVRRPFCMLGGGETTVTLGTRPGRGGRNQEFALVGATVLDGASDLLLLSMGTDGIDGPTDAAGGWADGTTAGRARRKGVDLTAALERHDAYPALHELGTLIITGPTGTNVMDLHVGLAGRRRGPAS